MKKTELLNKLADIQTQLEDNKNTIKAAVNELTDIITMIEELPTEPEEIEDDEEK